MNNLVHADIFFFVTTIVVAIVGLLFAVLIVYVLIIVHNIKKLSERLKREGIEIVDEFSDWRERMSDLGKKGFGLGSAVMFFQNLFKGNVKTKSSKKHASRHRDNDENEEDGDSN